MQLYVLWVWLSFLLLLFFPNRKCLVTALTTYKSLHPLRIFPRSATQRQIAMGPFEVLASELLHCGKVLPQSRNYVFIVFHVVNLWIATLNMMEI